MSLLHHIIFLLMELRAGNSLFKLHFKEVLFVSITLFFFYSFLLNFKGNSFFLINFYWSIQLIYNVVLVSAVQQSECYTYTCIPSFLDFFPV